MLRLLAPAIEFSCGLLNSSSTDAVEGAVDFDVGLERGWGLTCCSTGFAAIVGLNQQTTETQAVPTLIEALKDPHPKVRQKAGTVLGHFGDPRAINGLIALLQDEHHYPRESAIQALRKIGSAKALQHLSQIASAGNQDQALAHHAKQAIEAIAQSSGVQLPR